KCDDPRNTIERIRAGFSRLGIDDITFQGIDEGAWAAKNLYSGHCESYSLRARSTGKGTSPLLAAASGHAELAERFSAYFYRGNTDAVHVGYFMENAESVKKHFRYAFMKGYVKAHQDDLEAAVKIEDLLGSIGGLTEDDLARIKASENASHWVDAHSLLSDRTVKIPPLLVRYISGTNGISAGNTIEEAIAQASCEILERWAMRRVITRERVPTIDPDTIENPVFHSLFDAFHRENLDIVVKDFSLDGLLPCIGILTINRNLREDSVEHRIIQLGAAFNREEALMRCFTERSQGRVDYRPLPKYEQATCTSPENVTDYYFLLADRITDADISYLERGELRPFPKHERIIDCLDEIDQIKKICKVLGTDFIVVDHTHPVLQFPTVRVIMPGLSDVMPYYPAHLKTRDKLIEQIESACEYEKTVVRLMESFFA
ncbi:MAG: YcaO-like family protein, partial [Deltaproteobacteria bacterium]|nr:YcaO-like family protein [Deltaproteobacteria bacterium]